MSPPGQVRIRPALDTDAPGLIALLGAAFAQYPGCILDVDEEEPDLKAIATAYGRYGGQFWVAVAPTGSVGVANAVVGSVGWVPTKEPGMIELRKLYVAADYRRHGLASQLLALVETAATSRQASGIGLWSDSRFLEGHQFYLARGFEQRPQTRQLFDLSDSTEYRFVKLLAANASEED
jgi:putative acetyltransferase